MLLFTPVPRKPLITSSTKPSLTVPLLSVPLIPSLVPLFLLRPLSEGGVCEYSGDEVYLYEYTNLPLVLNGWIFSIWGLYDLYKYTKEENLKPILDRTIATLKRSLPSFDMKYWSKYDAGKCVASPFYHSLHIAQLRVMYKLFGGEEFSEYAQKWEKYQNSFWNPKRAFIKKALQKVFEKD